MDLIEPMLNLFSILHWLFWGFIVVALIYLIFKRIEDKKKENFEKRDN